jgi:hypothetical protein
MCFKDVVAIVVGGRMIVMSRTSALKMCLCFTVKWTIEKQTRAIAPASFSS